MKANLIRIPKSKQPKASGSAAAESAEDTSDEIFVGMDVEARFRGKDDWCRATVMKEHQGKGGTTYDLKYTDGKSVSESAFGSSHVWRYKQCDQIHTCVFETQIIIRSERVVHIVGKESEG